MFPKIVRLPLHRRTSGGEGQGWGQTTVRFLFFLFLAIASGLLVAGFTNPGGRTIVEGPPGVSPSPTPTNDPLAIPVLPEHPTEIELGKHSYYYNCMPCHGDQGQGLTDAWRQEWEEDHRNCWERGCHGGRQEDEGFPIPTVVPAVILDDDALKKYAQPEDLLTYLRTTHPPQAPGRLTEDDYRTLVAYLWSANNKGAGLAAQVQAEPPGMMNWRWLAAGILAGGVLLALLVLAYLKIRRKAG
jgi:hypothetical protein